MKKTLCIIKPETAQDGEAVCAIFSMIVAAWDLTIERIKAFQYSKELAEEFYGEHKGKEFYEGLIEYTMSAPVIAMELSGTKAVSAWREMIGATNPKDADQWTIRSLFGKGTPNNAVHGSANDEDAEREIKLIFGEQ